jgi:hypothetical protein
MTKSVVIVSNNFHTDLHNLIIRNISMISNFNYLYNYFHLIKDWFHINWTKQEHSHICESIMPSMWNLSKNYLPIPQLGFFYTNISPQLQLNCFKLLKHLQLEILISYITMWPKKKTQCWIEPALPVFHILWSIVIDSNPNPNLDWLSVQRISTRFPTMAFLHPCSYDQHPPACPIMLQVKMCWLAGKSSDLHVELLSLNCTKFKSGAPHPVFDNCTWHQTASAPEIIFSNL